MAEAAKLEESVQNILIPVGYELAWCRGRRFLSDAASHVMLSSSPRDLTEVRSDIHFHVMMVAVF